MSVLSNAAPCPAASADAVDDAVAAVANAVAEPFVPLEPQSLQQTGLTPSTLEGLILRYVLNVSHATGRAISEQICLPFGIVQEALIGLKSQMLVSYRNSAPMGDYVYELSEEGVRRARHHMESCTYFGSAPVPLDDYDRSVQAQALRNFNVTVDNLYDAFSDLVFEPLLLSQLGQAINSGKGIFLYGPPGNGKTSIAERVMRACHEEIWIPRTIGVTGELIRLYDPSFHEICPVAPGTSLLKERFDRRWIRIRRPTVVVGGELTMKHLEISTSATTGVSEAPVQIKSNCGALVVDDFGRQQVSTGQLLNRWIVPLERRFDHLTLNSGRQVRFPFEQLLVFATNLEPHDVADEAFLRRLPYKVDVQGPSEQQFGALVERLCGDMGIEFDGAAVEHLLAKHYRAKGRELRFCHPRDLLEQIASFCDFQRLPKQLNSRNFDVAAYNYFAGL